MRATVVGTHLREWFGIKPTGKRVRVRVFNLDRVSAGRIVEHWGEIETLALLQQLGIDPLAAQE